MERKDITKEEIEEAIAEVFYGKMGNAVVKRMPSIVNNRWEEGGVKYSSWTIDTGSAVLQTGDGGAELFFKAFMDAGFKTPTNDGTGI